MTIDYLVNQKIPVLSQDPREDLRRSNWTNLAPKTVFSILAEFTIPSVTMPGSTVSWYHISYDGGLEGYISDIHLNKASEVQYRQARLF